MYEVHEVFADGDCETRGGYDSRAEARESIRKNSTGWVIWHPAYGTVDCAEGVTRREIRRQLEACRYLRRKARVESPNVASLLRANIKARQRRLVELRHC